MQTNQLLAMFSGSLLLLGLIAFFLARGKAARVRASGTSMYAQPDQYGWFTVMSTAGPALVVGAVGSFIMLLVGAEIPPLLLLAFPPGHLIAELGVVTLYAAAILTLWSMIQYLRAAWPHLSRSL